MLLFLSISAKIKGTHSICRHITIMIRSKFSSPNLKSCLKAAGIHLSFIPRLGTMNSSSMPSLDFSVAELSGPLLLGSTVDWALFAVLTVQLYLYYQAFPKDLGFTKCLVYSVYSINLTQVVCATINAMNIFGYGFGQISALNRTGLAWLVSPVFGGIVACIVQSFYAFRLYRFSSSPIVPCILVFLSVGIAVSAFIVGAAGRKSSTLMQFSANPDIGVTAPAFVWLVGSAVIDLTIAACMTYYLARSDTGFRQTHALITKLIRLSIETGSLTAAMAVIILVLFVATPGKAYYMAPGAFICQVYANTMLGVLNSRFQILNGRAYVSPSDILMSLPSHLRGTMDGTVLSIARDEFARGQIEAKSSPSPFTSDAESS